MSKHSTDRLSANYLHNKLDIPYSYLRQVLHELSENGFINGAKGRNGGFTFSRDVNTIFISEIIDSTEGLESFNRCIMGFDKCPFDGECPMHPVWEKTRNEILEVLKKTTLAELSLK